ncbi:hypothetical protein JQS30_02430 [Natronoglycomyces albus]|uniref:DUF3109 family protein n=1 Tax=Natronoglycomyces albus TaxID=2811108 RepID=A0A895XNJ5_9ACTN|nr:hypothetical protein JQS30_02430 [Natronoglycomyces albus]
MHHPTKQEVDPDFDREWVEFTDPDDPQTVVRADLTWLMSSWGCIFMNGCPGISDKQPEDGCCLHGAFYTDKADIKRVRQAVKRLTPQTWQYHTKRFADTIEDDTLENDEGEEEPAKKTAVVDGGCIFLNREGFGAGKGCALHAQALRDGVHPMDYKPEVCWQLPVKRDFTTESKADGTDIEVTWITEFDRRSWGAGGHDFDWWCTGSPLAHTASKPVWESYEHELIAMLGKAAYDRLAQLCQKRAKMGLVAPHPATVQANQELAEAEAVRED